jgi:hypothetical protein
VHGARIFRRISQQSRLYKLSLIQRRLRVALGGSGAFDGLEPCEFGLCLAHFLAQLIAFEPQVLSERLQVARSMATAHPQSSRLLGRKMSDTCTGVPMKAMAEADLRKGTNS